MMRKLVAVALAAGATLGTTSAFAQSRNERAEEVAGAAAGSVAGLLGFGGGYAGFGVGARGGYQFANHLYVGGTFIDYPLYFGNTYGGSANSWLFGGEAGYNIAAGPIVVRPYGGLGLIDTPSFGYYGNGNPNQVLCNQGFTAYCTGYGYNGGIFFAFWAGGTVLFPITEHWFVGGDLRLILAGYSQQTFTAALMATGGYQF